MTLNNRNGCNAEIYFVILAFAPIMYLVLFVEFNCQSTLFWYIWCHVQQFL
ncbi:unnamed protein product [Ixodes pacificus]